MNTRHTTRITQRARLAGALRAAISPAAFATRCGFVLDDWQRAVLESDAPHVLLNCSRQSGKSTVTALLGLWTALYQAPALVLMVSPTQRQSGELFRKAADAYRALGRPVPASAESALQLELSNGSRLVALPGREGTIRSYSGASLLLLDEASRIEEETYQAVRPMLAVSRGRLVALSTPHGSRGWWYEAWRACDEAETAGQRPEWARWCVPAEMCPRITPDFLESERAQIGWWWFEQEYHCTFLDSRTAAFRAEDIARAFSEDYDTWDLRGLNTPTPAAAEDQPPDAPAPLSAPPAAHTQYAPYTGYAHSTTAPYRAGHGADSGADAADSLGLGTWLDRRSHDGS